MSEKLKRCSNPDCVVHEGETCAKGEVHPETHCVYYLRAELERVTAACQDVSDHYWKACKENAQQGKDLAAAIARAERAELERDTATRTVEDIQGKVAMYDGKRRVAEARAEKAEAAQFNSDTAYEFALNELEQVKAERDVLAKECAEFQKIIDCDAENQQHDYRYWLEYAAHEHAKRGEGIE